MEIGVVDVESGVSWRLLRLLYLSESGGFCNSRPKKIIFFFILPDMEQWTLGLERFLVVVDYQTG